MYVVAFIFYGAMLRQDFHALPDFQFPRASYLPPLWALHLSEAGCLPSPPSSSLTASSHLPSTSISIQDTVIEILLCAERLA